MFSPAKGPHGDGKLK